MAKFNERKVDRDLRPDTNIVLNHEGSEVHSLNAIERLFNKVMASMFGENTFYEQRSAKSDFRRLERDVEELTEEDKEYALKIALLGRKNKMITYPLELLTVCFNNEKYKGEKFLDEEGRNKLQYYTDGIVLRAKDITEILSAHFTMYPDRPLPMQLRKALRKKLESFDKYKLSKGLSKNNEVTLADAIKLLRPKPKNEEMARVYRDIIENNLKFGGDKKQLQTELIKAGQGRSSDEDIKESLKQSTLQAIIQNLVALNRRGLLDDLEVLSIIVEKLENPEEVERSKLLPYKFYSAYKVMEKTYGYGASKIRDALAVALDNSIKNVPDLKGYSAILVDVSGSMDYRINKRSIVTAKEVALLLGAIAYKKGIADLYVFASDCERITGINRHSTVVDIVYRLNSAFMGYSTELQIALSEIERSGQKYDNLIILSDNDCYGYDSVNNVIHFGSSWRSADSQINSLIKRGIIKKVWINDLLGNDFAIANTESYRKNLVSGFSERFIEMINVYEELRTGDIRKVIDRLLEGGR